MKGAKKLKVIKEIISKLDKLSEFRATEAAIGQEYDKKRTKLLIEVQPKLDRLYGEYEKLFAKAREAVEDREQHIKALVVSLKESVKGSTLHAVFMNGRPSWDHKGLDGYAVAHPELLKLKKDGDPSVSIREVKSSE